MHLGRKAIRMAGGAALGATAGAIGLAAGIASGDASKAMQYTAAGALGGYKMGAGVANKTVDALEVPGTFEKAKEYYHQGDEEYKQKLIDQRAKRIQKDYELRLKAEQVLGSKEEADKFMKEDVQRYNEYGVEKEDMLAVKQLVNAGVNEKEAASIALVHNLYSENKDTRVLGSKADEELNKTIRNRYAKNISDEDEKKHKVEDIRYKLNMFSGFKYDD